jgi:hypothetical protein
VDTRLLLVAVTLVGACLACGGSQKTPTVPAQDCRGGKVFHQDDSVRFRGCTIVSGNLQLGGALLSTDDFASLEQVEGNLVVGPSYQLNNMSALAGLRLVGGSLQVKDNMGLGGLFLGQLGKIGEDLRIEGNLALRSISLHQLKSIGGELAPVSSNRVLERVDLSGLKVLGGAELKIDWRKDRPEAVLRAPLY